MKQRAKTPPLLSVRQRSRRSHRESRALLEGFFRETPKRRTPRNRNLTNDEMPVGPPSSAPLDLAVESGPYSHIRVAPNPPVEARLEQRTQGADSFTFQKSSFSEEAEATVSSYFNPYKWQVNLATGSDGSSFAQKARLAELNAAIGRRAGKTQLIDDEIPDLSGPSSLGTYKFKLRDRGHKYGTHRLTELQTIPEQQGENTVTESASISSAHPPYNPPLPPTLSSFPRSEGTPHQDEGKLNDSISSHSEDRSLDRLGFHKTGPSQYDKLTPPLSAANLPEPIHPTYTDRLGTQASSQARSSYRPSQGHRSSPDSSVLVNSAPPGLEAPAQANSSVSTEHLSSNLLSGSTFNLDKQISQSAFKQADSSVRLQDHSSSQEFDPSINSDRRNPQASQPIQPLLPRPDRQLDASQQYSQSTKRVNALIKPNDHSPNQNFNASLNSYEQASKETQPSFPQLDRQLDTSQRYGQFGESLNHLIKPDGPRSRASEQASYLLPLQKLQRPTSEPYQRTESKADALLETPRQSLQASSRAQRSSTPKDYASLQSLPLSDTPPTASFNLETNQWDPDLPEASMSAHTPANKSSRGGHSLQLSRPTSPRVHPSQDTRNPHAIVTTTKSGRPYTNPYMPIDPPPSAAGQLVRESSSRLTSLEIQTNDAELVSRQRKTRYIDQEEARYQALEQSQHVHAKETLDDPFQDQMTPTQQYGSDQPSNYGENAAYQAGYGHISGYHPAATTYASDPYASSFLFDAQEATPNLGTGPSPYHGQRSAYEQQYVINPRVQNPGVAPHEQRSAYEETKPRAAVRLPAVRGTTEQQKVFSQWPSLESLSLEEVAGNNAQDQHHRHTQMSIQPPTSRVSHAVPIRDPAAYTGSGLSTRRNQEALRQNLDTVVASAQGPTGSARTVMNDPHRDRQLPRRPSSTATDATVTGSTLRAQAPSYETATAQAFDSTNLFSSEPAARTSRRQGQPVPVEQYPMDYKLKSLEHAAAASEAMYRREAFQGPVIPPGFNHEAAMYTKNAGLPVEAIGAGNAFMNALARSNIPPKKNSQQHLEEAAAWFRRDPRDLSYAAAILPYETMNRMNPEQFPLEDRTPRSVGQLADDSQDDDPNDRAGQAATPRPIGHGRPAGFTTPPSSHGPRQNVPQTPFSTLSGVASVNDKEGMERSGRQFLENDAKAIEAMFGGVYGNLMAAKNGPYDYMNHYCPPPAHSIDHNANNNDTFFDPQWFATAPPARVGRDPRREQGEYEDPTLGSASRRGDHARGDARRDSGGRGGSGGRAWGRN